MQFGHFDNDRQRASGLPWDNIKPQVDHVIFRTASGHPVAKGGRELAAHRLRRTGFRVLREQVMARSSVQSARERDGASIAVTVLRAPDEKVAGCSCRDGATSPSFQTAGALPRRRTGGPYKTDQYRSACASGDRRGGIGGYTAKLASRAMTRR